MASMIRHLSRLFSPEPAKSPAPVLDICQVTNQLYVMGLPWKRRTEVSAHRNNVDELAVYLKRRFGTRFLLVNLSSKGGDQIDYSKFRNQVLHFEPDFGDSGHADVPAIRQTFSFCYAAKFWTELDPRNVLIVHCKNGKQRSGFFIACWLAYSGKTSDTMEGYHRFVTARLRGLAEAGESSAITTARTKGFSRSQLAFLNSWHFLLVQTNTLLKSPSTEPTTHLLVRIIARFGGPMAEPYADTPTVEVLVDGTPVFDSEFDCAPPDGSDGRVDKVSLSDKSFTPSNPAAAARLRERLKRIQPQMRWVQGSLLIDVNQYVRGDVCIRVLTGQRSPAELRKEENRPSSGSLSTPTTPRTAKQRIAVRFAFHSSMIPPSRETTTCPLMADRVDLPNHSLTGHPDDFAMHLIMEAPPDDDRAASSASTALTTMVAASRGSAGVMGAHPQSRASGRSTESASRSQSPQASAAASSAGSGTSTALTTRAAASSRALAAAIIPPPPPHSSQPSIFSLVNVRGMAATRLGMVVLGYAHAIVPDQHIMHRLGNKGCYDGDAVAVALQLAANDPVMASESLERGLLAALARARPEQGAEYMRQFRGTHAESTAIANAAAALAAGASMPRRPMLADGSVVELGPSEPDPSSTESSPKASRETHAVSGILALNESPTGSSALNLDMEELRALVGFLRGQSAIRDAIGSPTAAALMSPNPTPRPGHKGDAASAERERKATLRWIQRLVEHAASSRLPIGADDMTLSPDESAAPASAHSQEDNLGQDATPAPELQDTASSRLESALSATASALGAVAAPDGLGELSPMSPHSPVGRFRMHALISDGFISPVASVRAASSVEAPATPGRMVYPDGTAVITSPRGLRIVTPSGRGRTGIAADSAQHRDGDDEGRVKSLASILAEVKETADPEAWRRVRSMLGDPNLGTPDLAMPIRSVLGGSAAESGRKRGHLSTQSAPVMPAVASTVDGTGHSSVVMDGRVTQLPALHRDRITDSAVRVRRAGPTEDMLAVIERMIRAGASAEDITRVLIDEGMEATAAAQTAESAIAAIRAAVGVTMRGGVVGAVRHGPSRPDDPPTSAASPAPLITASTRSVEQAGSTTHGVAASSHPQQTETSASPQSASVKDAAVSAGDQSNAEASPALNPRALLEAAMLKRQQLMQGPPSQPAKASTPTNEPPASASSAPEVARFLKMLQMGMPRPAVEAKMLQAGLDAKLLDDGHGEPFKSKLHAESGAGAAASQDSIEHPSSTAGPLQDDERYIRFFKMLKMGVPRPAVEAKMQQEKLDPASLDADRTKPFKSRLLVAKPLTNDLSVPSSPSVADAEAVPIKEHPRYGPFVKKLKLRIPKGSLAAKMTAEGLDPAVLDLDPDQILPAKYRVANATGAANGRAKRPPVSNLMRKRIHWDELPADRLAGSTIWHDAHVALLAGSDTADLDEQEYKNLFTKAKGAKAKPKDALPTDTTQRVRLVEFKRATNVGIGTARFSMPTEQIRQCLLDLTCFVAPDQGSVNGSQAAPTSASAPEKDSSSLLQLTASDLSSLQDLLPTADEIRMVQSYKGPRSRLGEAEIFFSDMSRVGKAKARAGCLLFQRQFQARVTELRGQMRLLHSACVEVQSSEALRGALGWVLRVGHQLNTAGRGGDVAGLGVRGLAVTSLAKLSLTKAFDNKTTVLHFLVKQARKAGDEDALKLSSSLPSAAQTSRLTVPSLFQEVAELQTGLNHVGRMVDEQARSDGGWIGRGRGVSSSTLASDGTLPPDTKTDPADAGIDARSGDVTGLTATQHAAAEALDTRALSDAAIADRVETLAEFTGRATDAVAALHACHTACSAEFREVLVFLGQEATMEVSTLFSELHKFAMAVDRAKFDVDEQVRREELKRRRQAAANKHPPAGTPGAGVKSSTPSLQRRQSMMVASSSTKGRSLLPASDVQGRVRQSLGAAAETADDIGLFRHDGEAASLMMASIQETEAADASAGAGHHEKLAAETPAGGMASMLSQIRSQPQPQLTPFHMARPPSVSARPPPPASRPPPPQSSPAIIAVRPARPGRPGARPMGHASGARPRPARARPPPISLDNSPTASTSAGDDSGDAMSGLLAAIRKRRQE